MYKCCTEFKHSLFCSTIGEKLKLTIDIDDLSDRLWVAAFGSELHAEDCAVDIEFSANKILGFSAIHPMIF